MRELKIFSGGANPQLAEDICGFLHLPLGQITISTFPDGERHCKIEEDVRGRDVFLIQPTSPSVNDNLMELLIKIDSCNRASARSDRKDEGRVAIAAKLCANLITRAGADRVLAMDLHAAQIQGFFDVPVDHLYAAPVLNKYFIDQGIQEDNLAVVSPDEGSIKRAIGHVRRLGGKLAIVDKRRASALETTQENLIGGPIEGRVALMFDDMISTAGSICGAAELVKAAGASEIHVAATHGVFCGPALERLEDSPITSVVVTDTIPLGEASKVSKIKQLTVAPLLAEAIKRVHHDQSISDIFASYEP